MHRSCGTYFSRMIAKSGKSENGHIAVNSGISNSIQISRPGNSYANVSSAPRCISSRGVGLISSCCRFSGWSFAWSDIIPFQTKCTRRSEIQNSARSEIDEEVDEYLRRSKRVRIRSMVIYQLDAEIFRH